MPPAAVRRGAPKRRPQSARQAKEAPQAIDVADVTIEIEEISKTQLARNVLIYGPSGHGKTLLASFLPRCVMISTETGGPISAKRAGSTARVIQTPQWEHVVAAKMWADANLGKGDWVVLDSLTKMQVLMVRWILRTNKMENPSRDLDIPAIQDHQKWQNYFKRFVDELIDSPYNVVFVCGDMIKTDQDGEDIVLPHIEGKDYAICNYVRAQTSLNVYYAVTDKLTEDQLERLGQAATVRRALFQPVPPFVAPKDRFMAFGKYQDVEDGDFDAIARWAVMIDEVMGEHTDHPTAATPIATARRRKAATR
jgi:hypothetical protein